MVKAKGKKNESSETGPEALSMPYLEAAETE